MRKIMFFINTLADGGAEKVLTNFLKNASFENCEFTVITVTGGEHLSDIPQNIKVRQIIKTKNKLFARVFASIIYHLPKKLFAKLFLQGEYDLEIAYLSGFPTRALAAKDRTKAKRIAFVHETITKESMSHLLYKNTNDCLREYREYDCTCFVSKSAKDTFEKEIGKLQNGEVLYNVIDYKSAREKSGMPCPEMYKTSGMKIIAIGRLAPVKGFERLLQIIKQLKRYDFELWILGKGELKNVLQKFIEQEQLDEKVRLLGFIDNPYPYIKQADFLISSSYSEAYSTVVAESIALGIPVLTTRCAGMEEILNNGKYGIIVDNNDEALEEALEQILNGYSALEKIKNNTQQYSDQISEEVAVAAYQKLFERLL